MISDFKNIFKAPHGGVILLIAAIAFLSALFPRSLAYLPGLAGLGLYAFWPRLFQQNRFRPETAFRAALCITLCAVISSLWSADPLYALERSGKIGLVLLPGALWVAALTRFPETIKKSILKGLTVIAVIAAALFTSDLALDYPFMRLMHRLSGDTDPFRNFELNRGIVTLVFLFLPVLFFLYRERFSKNGSVIKALGASAALAALLVPILVMTQSQSAQMAFVAALFFMVFFPVKCRFAWLGLKIVFCLGILSAPFVAITLFSMVPHAELAQNMQGSWLQNANVLPRLEIWDFVSRYILDHFWIGSGVEATRLVAAFDTKELYQPGLTLLHPHNAILQIWMEFGLLGAVLTCAAAMLLLGRIATQPDPLSRRLSLGLLMAFCAVGMVGWGLWQGWWLGLIMFMVGLCALTQTPPSAENRA